MTEQLFRRESHVSQDAETVYAWHARPGAFERLTPPWDDVRIITPARVEDGECAVIEVPMGPFRRRWVARHQDVVPGSRFRDIQVSGPFAQWEHTHSFDDEGEGSRLVDEIVYRLPFGVLGGLGAGFARGKIERTFDYRHDLTRRDLARHAEYVGRPLRIAVSGAGGLVGRALCAFLRTGGHEVIELVRSREGNRDGVLWSVDHGVLEPERLDGIDALVHLAGAGIADERWTPARKKLIRDSRVDGTRNLLRSLRDSVGLPSVVCTASAIGLYGDRGDEVLDETSDAGEGFLADVCREWEAAAVESVGDATRLCRMRFGVITTSAGGALAKMLTPFKLGAGGPLGNGRQWMSWVSLDDAVHAIHHALTRDEVSGGINVVAPSSVTNREWGKALGRALGRPAIAPMPAFAARLVFGEMADELLLAGQRVIPAALDRSGFRFHDTDLENALRRVLGKVFTPTADEVLAAPITARVVSR